MTERIATVVVYIASFPDDITAAAFSESVEGTSLR